MANKNDEQQPAVLQLTKDDLRGMLSSVAEAAARAAKEPYVDPKEKEKAERQAKDLRMMLAEAEAVEEDRQAACPHTRDDGTSTWAWYMFHAQHRGTLVSTDFGRCQRCGKKLGVQNMNGEVTISPLAPKTNVEEYRRERGRGTGTNAR